MITFDQVLEDQLSDPGFRAEWERTRVAREVSTELVRYRAEHGLTQAALARRAGVSRSMIARLETGDYGPPVDVVAGLVEVFRSFGDWLRQPPSAKFPLKSLDVIG